MTQSAAAATLPVLRALLDEAGRKNYSSGVLGVRARPEWSTASEFTYGATPVRVVPCESVLAVWEAITTRDQSHWLVVITDREDEDLGSGIRAHLVGNRLRTPDPWEAVRHRFAATGLDPALASTPGHREIANGLLATAPTDGWPPAPAGVITRDHAFAAVAGAHLAFADPVVDLTSVLSWTAQSELASRIADLRELAGDPLADAVLDWAASRCGAVAAPVRHLLRAGEARDCLPLGLVAGLLAKAGDSADAGRARIGREGLIRIEGRLGGSAPGRGALEAWAAECAAVIIDLLGDRARQSMGDSLLARADELLGGARAEAVADDSDLLRLGLSRRLAGLAAALRRELGGQQGGRAAPDHSSAWPGDVAEIEQAWSRIVEHVLAHDDQRVTAFHAAVRLARWLSTPSVAALPRAPDHGPELARLVSRHADQDAWADSAVNDAAAGVSDPDLGAALTSVLAAATARRSAHDADFARALARYTAGDGAAAGFRLLEDLLPSVVIPLARSVPVLLLVLDGMSTGVAAEIMSSLLERAADGWAEALLPGETRRNAALAVLPTVTEVSRASLLAGRLTTGAQDAEALNYKRLCRESGLPGAVLFHKKPLDSSLPGQALAGDVASAIADVSGIPLVACVLNTIDDALDRSDPGGTEWTADAVKHLLPLLDRARYAGRTVIITADHGHVVERRLGTQRSYPDTSSGRSRAAEPPAGDGEVLVTGQRVLLHGGRAVLAVDERLRYGPLKAGYHGGASPAEAVVPVIVLVSGIVPEGTGLGMAPPQEPAWWTDPVIARPVRAGEPGRNGPDKSLLQAALGSKLRSASDGEPTLFDLPAAETARGTASQRDVAGETGPDAASRNIAQAVIDSAVYTAQRKIAGRLSVPDDRVRDLLAGLLATPSGRMSSAQAAATLAVAQVAVRGAILHVQRLLNVEGYAVLRIDADGATVILDEHLLREQFGIRP
jgi:hypothetical protein